MLRFSAIHCTLHKGGWSKGQEFMRNVCAEYHAKIPWDMPDHNEPELRFPHVCSRSHVSYDAHPMSMLTSAFAMLGSYYSEANPSLQGISYNRSCQRESADSADARTTPIH